MPHIKSLAMTIIEKCRVLCLRGDDIEGVFYSVFNNSKNKRLWQVI